MSSALFFILSYILLLTTNNVIQIYVARLIQGFGVGFVMTVQPMYIGEIASDSVRGALGSLMQLFITGLSLAESFCDLYLNKSLFSWNLIRLHHWSL